MTLDQLHEDYKEWRAYFGFQYVEPEQMVRQLEYLSYEDGEYSNRQPLSKLLDDLGRVGATALYFAAKRYLVARDFNEFDPERADILWKREYGDAA